MLRQITLKFGSSPGQQPLVPEPGPTTVFVGPNNSGKSLVLIEIERVVLGENPQGRRIVESVEATKFGDEEARSLIEGRRNESQTAQQPPGQVYLTNVHPIDGRSRSTSVGVDQAVGFLTRGDNPQWIFGQILSLYTLRLDGQTRLGLVAPRQSSDLLAHPQNLLSSLFANDDARLAIRRITADAFGLHFVIDPTAMTQLRVRMAKRPPEDSLEEQALDARARAYHEEASPIQDLSDGVKAFTGLVAAIMSSDYRLMLIDEPEAFLHPPLAKKLGRTVAELAAKRNGHVIASTHSAEVLMGAIESGRPANVVRLTYENGVPSARLLSAAALSRLMRDPLLRSTGVLSALFHKGAIVCEADSDRAFYREVNERLLAAGKPGAVDVLFVNAHSKDVLRRIARPLRELGIPAAIIVDLDVIKGKDSFNDLLSDCFVPPALVQAWATLRGNVNSRFEAQDLDMKQGGLALLEGAAKEEAETLLSGLVDYGIFVVPLGELERWLETLGAGAHGNAWLSNIFDRMGTDPDLEGYVTPVDGDVWDFIKRIAAWLANPTRKGIPLRVH